MQMDLRVLEDLQGDAEHQRSHALVGLLKIHYETSILLVPLAEQKLSISLWELWEGCSL